MVKSCKKHNWFLHDTLNLYNESPPHYIFKFICPDCEKYKEIKVLQNVSN